MGIDKSHIPDISVVSNLEGNEVMIVEVKASYPSEDANQAVRLLKEYMVSFYTEVGLLVTPTETVVMNKTYLDKKNPEGYAVKFLPTHELFGQIPNFQSGSQFEEYVYLKIMELVDRINRSYSSDVADLISPELRYILMDAQVMRRRV